MRNLMKFSKLSTLDKRMYLEALLISVRVKLMVSLLPLRWYAHTLGKQNLLTQELVIEGSYPAIYKVSQAIIRCQKSVPWQTRCFVNAITAKFMLQKRGLESTLYLGVNKEDQKMTAHAWLRCGTYFVTGRREMGKFVVVNTFS